MNPSVISSSQEDKHPSQRKSDTQDNDITKMHDKSRDDQREEEEKKESIQRKRHQNFSA
jgi:hypothetical protein